MEKIQLNNDVSISRIVQGFWRLHQWNLDAKQLVDFMHQCVDLGVTSFDTAEVYGNYNSEALLGEALSLDPSLRSKIEIITKTGINKPHPDRPYRNKYFDTTYDKIIQSCNESLQKLNTSYIDVYLIHREDPLIDHAEVARAFNDLKQAGKIKAFGVIASIPLLFNSLLTVIKERVVLATLSSKLAFTMVSFDTIAFNFPAISLIMARLPFSFTNMVVPPLYF